jgi:hypothetical protein
MLLTREELQQLTGYRQPSRMAAWLAERGWVFEPPARRGDIPKVDRAFYLARMSGAQPGRRREGPRLDFMIGARVAPAKK